MACHASSSTILTFENLSLGHGIGEGLVDVFGFKSGVVDIVEPPVCCFTYDGRAVVMAQVITRTASSQVVLENPLPDLVEDEAE